MLFQIRPMLIVMLVISMFFNGCSETKSDERTPRSSGTEKAHPLAKKTRPPRADFSQAAKELVKQSPDGIAIGEVHGQLAGIMLLEAVTKAALDVHGSVLVLHEFTPQEAGLNLDMAPKEDFQTYTMIEKTLPFWTDNVDGRATWELHAFFEKIAGMPDVSLSYLWDPRLNPPPKKLKAHGMAERWQIAKLANPNSYIVALGGNYHMHVSDRYPLDVTNSLCRYAIEKLGFRPSCVAVDGWNSPNENCQENQKAIIQKGEDVFKDWDYFVSRPDKCVVQAHWVNG